MRGLESRIGGSKQLVDPANWTGRPLHTNANVEVPYRLFERGGDARFGLFNKIIHYICVQIGQQKNGACRKAAEIMVF